MAASEPKRGDFSSLIKWALGRGWTEVRSGKHIVLQWQVSHRKCVLPRSSSDHRAWLNAYKTMQRIERGSAE